MTTSTQSASVTDTQTCTCHGNFTRRDPSGNRYCGYCYLPKP